MPRSSGTRHGNGSAGGAPKGAGSVAPKAPAFEPGNKTAAGYHDMSRRQRLEALQERQWMVGMGMVPGVLPSEVNAMRDYQNRELGTPIARTITHEADDIATLTDAALVEQREVLERAIREGAAGTASPDGQAVVLGVRH